MATVNQNLSDYDAEKVPDGAGMKLAIVVGEWNANITNNLLQGAYDTLVKHGVSEEDIRVVRVPGSFELPSGAQLIFEAHPKTDGIVCLGSVIQGETKHFDFVCEGTAMGIKDVALKYNKPVIFGVLTDNTLQQSIDRSGGKHGNKGTESAVTVIKMVALKKALEARNSAGIGFV